MADEEKVAGEKTMVRGKAGGYADERMKMQAPCAALASRVPSRSSWWRGIADPTHCPPYPPPPGLQQPVTAVVRDVAWCSQSSTHAGEEAEGEGGLWVVHGHPSRASVASAGSITAYWPSAKTRRH